MSYLFTSESVSEGHPDKIADQISDSLIDHFLAFDPDSKVACETLVTTGQVVLAGEVNSKAYLDVQQIARDVIAKIGYTKSEYMFEAHSCGVLSAIHEQSPDINQGVVKKKPEEQGAGDQGMMFGYATNETDNYMPLALDLSHHLLKELAAIRHEGKEMPYLRPDAKSQVTIEYDDNNKPVRIDSIVVSTQHDDFVKPTSTSKSAKEAADKQMLERIKKDIIGILISSARTSPTTSTPPAPSSLAAHTVIPALPAARSLWTPTAEKEHTVVALSAERIPARWTVVLLTQPVTSRSTSWLQAYATRPWCRWPMPSA